MNDDDPLMTELMADAPPRPAKDYVVCPMTWLAQVRLYVSSADQLLVAMLLYRKCLLARSKTVALSNVELQEAFGVSRQVKYRALDGMEEVGAITVEASNGQSVCVTLHWFPQAPVRISDTPLSGHSTPVQPHNKR